jgi:hypothetical protein
VAMLRRYRPDAVESASSRLLTPGP